MIAFLVTLAAAFWAYLGFTARKQPRYYEQRPALDEIDAIHLEMERR